MSNMEDNEVRYFVVMNHEEQYSIWPASRAIPAGWTAVGEPGSKAACLEYVERTWTDMRPRGLREKMEQVPS
jgi:MbtH protein